MSRSKLKMTALQVGDQVTIRPLSLKTIERQRHMERLERAMVSRDIVIRGPFNFVGVCMTIDELAREYAYCTVHDLRVRLNTMNGKSSVCLPRKYLKRIKKGTSHG
jgi:hypothetical protein